LWMLLLEEIMNTIHDSMLVSVASLEGNIFFRKKSTIASTS